MDRPKRTRRQVDRIRSSVLTSSDLKLAAAPPTPPSGAPAESGGAAHARNDRKRPAVPAQPRGALAMPRKQSVKAGEDAASRLSTPRKKVAGASGLEPGSPTEGGGGGGGGGRAAKRRRRIDADEAPVGGSAPIEEGQSRDAVKGEESEEEAEELSEYEKLRKANMDRNKLILDALELPSMPATVKGEAMVSVRARGLKGTRKQEEVLPTRERSLRAQGLSPSGEKLELPADWREPVRFNPSSRKEAGGSCSFGIMGTEDDRSERRTGKLTVADCVPRDGGAEDPEAHLSTARAVAEDLVTKLHSSDMKDSARAAGKAGRADLSLAALQRLQVSESDVAKVCPQRIASIAFHPMEQHVVVAAGAVCVRAQCRTRWRGCAHAQGAGACPPCSLVHRGRAASGIARRYSALVAAIQ